MRYFKWLIIYTLTSLTIVILVVNFKQKPPIGLMSVARSNLAKAEKFHASKYSRDLYIKAKLCFDSAMTQWNIENEKFFISRNYKLVEKNANQSNIFSLKAIEQSAHNLVKIENNISVRISRLQRQIDSLNKQFGNFPFNGQITNKLANCKLLLNEVILAYKQSEYLIADEKLVTAELSLNEISDNYDNLIEEYFKSYPDWKKLIEKTILDSKKSHSYSIIIDKYNRECLLYKKGELKVRYTIELGTNWIGDKNYQGDKTTPEGYYKIVGLKKNGETKYYKALLLNYPNDEDKKRFVSNKKNGIIGKDAKIGNLIEIHGNGGKGIDWTDGCVALHNEDMDKLFEVCKPGTIVTIVGSTKPLNEIYKSVNE
jgi:murein L,D-transpeptidase YafK